MGIAGVSESRCIFDYTVLSRSMTYAAAVQRVSVSDFENLVDVHADDKFDKNNVQTAIPMKQVPTQKGKKRGEGSEHQRGTVLISQLPDEPLVLERQAKAVVVASAAPVTPKTEPELQQQDFD